MYLHVQPQAVNIISWSLNTSGDLLAKILSPNVTAVPLIFSAQLSDTYATGQEKILEMQEIRSDVHNKLYVFLK